MMLMIITDPRLNESFGQVNNLKDPRSVSLPNS